MGVTLNPFTGQLDITGSGGSSATQWKDSVADFASLPLVGNSDGDVRVTRDTDNIYVWDAGSTSWVLANQLQIGAFGTSPNANGLTLGSGGPASTVASHTTGVAGAAAFAANNVFSGQGFKPSASVNVTQVQAYLKYPGTPPTGTFTVRLYDDNAGVPGTLLATSSAVNVSVLTTSYAPISFTFPSPAAVTSGSTYYWIIDTTGVSFAGGAFIFIEGDLTDVYPDGISIVSTDSGATWIPVSGKDYNFTVDGAGPGGQILNLQPADATHPGGVSITTQSFGGNKTFTGNVSINGTTTLNSGLTGPLKATSGVVSASSINLTSEVTGVLPVANGGTNSSSALNNNRVLISSGGAIVEQVALTASRALQTDGSGLPAVSAVTSTELGYVSGVTSAIQTQLNAKLNLSGGTMTGTLTLNADPVNPLEASTKQYVDSVAQGLNVKQSVKVATTANITLSGEQTIDGVLTSASRVLVKNQSTQTENGIYLSAAGAWSRTSDANAGSELVSAFVFVEEGTLGGDTGWVQTTNSPITIGSSNIVWTQFAGAGTYTADGNALKLTGTQFAVSLDSTTLSQSVSGLKVATGGITNTEVAAAANIARSKLASGTANHVIINDSLGALSSEAVLAVSRGGTNSGSALVNNRIVISSAGALVENAAITASRALESDSNGIPQASATTSTELGYVSGVTSSIQTQINSKVTGPASATDNAIARYDSTTGKLIQDSLATIDDSGNITANNISGSISGTNTGDVTLAAFGTTPNANGASLTGQALNLQPADGTNPGGVSTTTQTFAGNKTFTGSIRSDVSLILKASGSSNTITVQAPALASSYSLTLPVDDGVSGQFLQTDGSGVLAWATTGSPGDIQETSFTANDNEPSPQNVTGFTFSNAVVRSFDALVSIVRGSTYEVIKIQGIQKGSSWEISQASTGDDTGIVLSITTAGVVQYTSTNTGSNATLKFRAIVTGV